MRKALNVAAVLAGAVAVVTALLTIVAAAFLAAGPIG